jgi:hypothetical protein
VLLDILAHRARMGGGPFPRPTQFVYVGVLGTFSTLMAIDKIKLFTLGSTFLLLAFSCASVARPQMTYVAVFLCRKLFQEGEGAVGTASALSQTVVQTPSQPSVALENKEAPEGLSLLVDSGILSSRQ